MKILLGWSRDRIPGRCFRAGLAMALLGALSLSACSGSEEGGGGSPTGPSPAILFTPDRGAGPVSIAMRMGAGSTASVLRLEIFATEVTNLQAVDFVLLVPNSLLRFDNFERGDFIGAAAQVLIAGGGSNAVTFQILRTAPSAATGTGLILTLTFTAVGAGSGRFDFLDPVAEDPFGLVIPGIDWIGGAVQVVL